MLIVNRLKSLIKTNKYLFIVSVLCKYFLSFYIRRASHGYSIQIESIIPVKLSSYMRYYREFYPALGPTINLRVTAGVTLKRSGTDNERAVANTRGARAECIKRSSGNEYNELN